MRPRNGCFMKVFLLTSIFLTIVLPCRLTWAQKTDPQGVETHYDVVIEADGYQEAGKLILTHGIVVDPRSRMFDLLDHLTIQWLPSDGSNTYPPAWDRHKTITYIPFLYIQEDQHLKEDQKGRYQTYRLIEYAFANEWITGLIILVKFYVDSGELKVMKIVDKKAHWDYHREHGLAIPGDLLVEGFGLGQKVTPIIDLEGSSVHKVGWHEYQPVVHRRALTSFTCEWITAQHLPLF